VLTYSEDRKLRAWDAETGHERRAVDWPDEILLLTIPAGGENVLAWTRPLGATGDDQTHSVHLINPATLKPVESLSDRGRPVSCLAFSGDGGLVAMGTPDGTVRVWDVAKKERVGGDRSAGTKDLMDLAVLPDRKHFVTGDKGGEIRVWALDKADPVRTFRCGVGDVSGLAVSLDGSRLAVFGNGTVDLCDLANGQSLRRWDLGVAVNTILHLPDGKHLATANKNGTIYLLDLP